MASVSSPYGAQPISSQGGLLRPQRIQNGITSGYSTQILKYQPVYMIVTGGSSGTLGAVTTTTQAIWGIFAGCYYTPTGGRPTESPYWPASTVYDSTYDMWAEVWPAWDPEMRIRVQADGTVAQTQLGQQFNFNNLGNPASTTVGLSQCTVAHAGVASSSQGQVVLTEFFDNTGVYGTIGDAFTDLIVAIALPQIGFAPLTSLG